MRYIRKTVSNFFYKSFPCLGNVFDNFHTFSHHKSIKIIRDIQLNIYKVIYAECQ